MNEDLRNWFSKSHPEGNWKRYNTKGEAIGPCAREPGEPKPKCLSNEKAAKMSKNEIASAVKRKRKKDPVADRKGKGGKPKMVSNKIDEAKKQPDHEYSMIRSELQTIRKAVDRLRSKMKGEGNVEAWVQSKITKAADYIDSAADYIDSGEHNVHGSMDEAKKDPCWKGYKQVGTKKKNGKKVPNCVPVNETSFEIKHTSADVKNANRLKKIDALARRGTGGEQENAARMSGVSLPSIKKEEISIVDKILLEMEAEVLNEKNIPTNPSLWSKMKSRAKAKFDIWPSAYASGWAAKEYKKAGGKWKSVSEEIEIQDAYGETFAVIDDVIKSDPIVCERCGQNPCICDQLMGYNEVNETIRIPSKTGNILLTTLNWRGKYYAIKMFFPQVSTPNRRDVQDQINKVYPGARVLAYNISDIKPGEQFLQTEDWQKVNRQDKTDGLSQKAVDAYRRENPGSKLKTAVTEKNPEGKRAKRRKSFCSRMKGHKAKNTSAETARDPDSRINKALRRWRCN
jgi:hypothetical protein